MIRIFIASIASVFLLVACGDATYVDELRKAKVSYETFELEDEARQRPLSTKIWYPADQNAVESSHIYDNGFVGVIAKNREIVAGKSYPLVLLSHGTGGSNANLSWLAEILASNGFIVAATNHWNNFSRQNTPSGIVRLWDRPKDLSFVLDFFLQDSKWESLIDQTRIYAAGFSAGGFTVLGLAGAKYSPIQIDAFCRMHPDDGDCKVADGIDFSTIDFSDAASSYMDRRFKAVLAMAPAVGKGILLESLKGISIPVSIVASKDDEWVVVESNAKLYAENIPSASLTLFEKGGHFAFMQDCSAIAKLIVWLTVEEDVCGFESDVNRRELQHVTASVALKLFGAGGNGQNKSMQPKSG